MPPRRNSRKRRKQVQSNLEKLLTKQSIPIIDKRIYDMVYPSSSRSKSQLLYGMTEAELNSLPKPVYKTIKEYNLEAMPAIPEQYIPFKQSIFAEKEKQVQYDMDDQDVAWLGLVNDQRVASELECVSEDIFELLIDKFEKESRYERRRFLGETLIEEISDDDAVCCICTGGISNRGNEILFCDMCNVAVHQECYGVPYVPEGQWLCRKCSQSPSRLLYCCLCHKASGLFKQTDKGLWCHILCAIWFPQVQFSNSVFLDPICCIERIPASSWNMTCTICKYKSLGACIKCKYRTCHSAFHASCAQEAGYAMMMNANSSGYNKQRVHGIYCPKHTPGLRSNKRCVDTNNIKLLRPHVVQSLWTNILLSPYIPPEKIQEISNLVNLNRKNIFFKKLLGYWALKRHLQKGVPLVRSNLLRLEQQPAVVAPIDDLNSIEPDKKEAERNEINQTKDSEKDQADTNDKYQETKQFRQNLEKVRLLCELVQKREKIKNQLYLINYKCLECQLQPLAIYLRKLTEDLIQLDYDNLFSKAIEGSGALTLNPTDFIHIKSKVDTYHYSNLNEYKRDFNAMISSRITGYAKRTKIYKYAMKLKEISEDKFKEAYRGIQSIDQSHIEEDNQLDSDLPEPLSPQVKTEPYENPSATEFAMEIDYYGFDPGPSTSSYQPHNQNRNRKDKDANSNQLQNQLQENIKQETQETNGSPSACDQTKSKTRKVKKIIIKRRKRRSGLRDERSRGPLYSVHLPPPEPEPQPGPSRKAAILFTKNGTRNKTNHHSFTEVKQEESD